MLDKIKELYRKNPKIFILVGGVALFFVIFLFNKVFKRDKTPERVRVAPGVVPVGGGAPVQQFKEHGLDPGFKDDLQASFEAINEKMLTLGEQMKNVGRDTVIIETIIERVEERQDDIKQIPAETFLTPGMEGLPYEVPDVVRTFDELKTALEEDIQRTIGLGVDERGYLEREFLGGFEGYLTHQKERLRILKEEGREIGHLGRRPGRPGG